MVCRPFVFRESFFLQNEIFLCLLFWRERWEETVGFAGLWIREYCILLQPTTAITATQRFFHRSMRCKIDRHQDAIFFHLFLLFRMR